MIMKLNQDDKPVRLSREICGYKNLNLAENLGKNELNQIDALLTPLADRGRY